jgi:hypothetical protein
MLAFIIALYYKASLLIIGVAIFARLSLKSWHHLPPDNYQKACKYSAQEASPYPSLLWSHPSAQLGRHFAFQLAFQGCLQNSF